MKKMIKLSVLALVLAIGVRFVPEQTNTADPRPPVGIPLSVEISEEVSTYNADPRPPVGY